MGSIRPHRTHHDTRANHHCLRDQLTTLQSRSVSVSEAQSRKMLKELPLGRFELFIDLIWVGIIGNLAGNFSDHAFDTQSTYRVGIYVLEFIILFLIAWRIWIALQEFMSKYHTTGLVERLFVVWIIVLAMLYGNNAPYLLIFDNPNNVAIVIFLVVNFSFIIVEGAFSVYIPSLRRELLLRSAFAVLTLALWIPAALTTIPRRASLVFAAIFVEYTMAATMVTPPVERLLKQDHLENFDSDHWVERKTFSDSGTILNEKY